jgi:hypothetical protein
MGMQEYDLNIEPTKFIKRIGLVELLKSHALVIVESPLIEDLIAYKDIHNETELVMQPWYDPIIYFLINGVCPLDMDIKAKQTLHLQVVGYVLQDRILCFFQEKIISNLYRV